ncbi:MAG: hypothetical protein K2K75_08805 [Muribaculaceae bacterium]|nr:hypothetical protein [Muribaculaceae bacterium]
MDSELYAFNDYCKRGISLSMTRRYEVNGIEPGSPFIAVCTAAAVPSGSRNENFNLKKISMRKKPYNRFHIIRLTITRSDVGQNNYPRFQIIQNKRLINV